MAPIPGDTPNGHARALRATALAAAAAERAVAYRPAAAAAVVLIAALASCRGSSSDHALSDDDRADDFGGLVASADPVEPVDVERAASDPSMLLRAVRVPHHRVGQLLGPHVFRATSSVDITVTGGGEPDAHEKLDVSARIEYADAQRFRALVENSADYGREIILADGQLYLRPRHGVFHRRPPNDEHEPAPMRDDIYAELSGHLQLVAGGLSVRDGGAADAAGRPARRIELVRADEPRPVTTSAPHRAWRSTVEVESLGGEILLDRETGVPLRARLEAVVRARREQRALRMHIVVEHHVEAIGQSVEITAPPEEQWVDTPVRSRELEERELLLEDIAQPARPAPTPENTATGAGSGEQPADPGRRRAAPEEAP